MEILKKLRRVIEMLIHKNRKSDDEAKAAEPITYGRNAEVATAAPATASAGAKPVSPTMLIQLEEFLFGTCDLRYNILTEQQEFRPKGSDGCFETVTKRVLNSITLDAQAAGIVCWDSDVSRIVTSNRLPDYHPMMSYMESLPEWDGADHVMPLIHRIGDDAVWENVFHRWLLAFTAQLMGHESCCANALAPILVSGKLGMRKSTFCRLFVLDSQRMYYTDRFDINAQSNWEQRLATTMLINMDEFDRCRPLQMASLKNVMQMVSSLFRKSHTSRMIHLPRRASFIGTSNSFELLCDPSCSRRFLCQEVTKPILYT